MESGEGVQDEQGDISLASSLILPQQQQQQQQQQQLQQQHYPLAHQQFYPVDYRQLLDVLRLSNPFSRQELLHDYLEGISFQLNHVQSGGLPQLVMTLDHLSGLINNANFNSAIREKFEGVLLDTQDVIQTGDWEDDRISSPFPFSMVYLRDKVYKCQLNRRETQFITKVYNYDQWHREAIEIPIICDNDVILKPLGVVWNSHKIYLFLPQVNGKTLAEVISSRQILSLGEVDLLCYKILTGLKDLHGQDFLHRNISPYHLMISRENQKIHLLGGGSMCRLSDSVSWLPTDTEYYSAPELVRGEAHSGKCDIYSTGCTLLSALTGQIPFFDINRNQVHGRNYTFRIGTGEINPQTYLCNLEQTPVTQMLRSMTDFNHQRRPSADDIIKNYYAHSVPQWGENYFGTRIVSADPLHRPRPDVNFIAQQPQDGILVNIPSEEILASAGEEEEEELPTLVEEHLPPEKADSVHSEDSGRLTNDDYTGAFEVTVTVDDDGREVIFPCQSTDFGSHIYRCFKISGGIKLWYRDKVLGFDTPLSRFGMREIVFTLERLHQLKPQLSDLNFQRQRNDSLTVEVSPDVQSPSAIDRLLSLSPEAQRQSVRGNLSLDRDQAKESFPGEVIMGAAYNGGDHIILKSKNDTEHPQRTPESPNRKYSDQGGWSRENTMNETPLDEKFPMSLSSHQEESLRDTGDDSSAETIINAHERAPPEFISQQCREMKLPFSTSTTLLTGTCSVETGDADAQSDQGEEVETEYDDQHDISEDEEASFFEREDEDDANEQDSRNVLNQEIQDEILVDFVDDGHDISDQKEEDALNEAFLNDTFSEGDEDVITSEEGGYRAHGNEEEEEEEQYISSSGQGSIHESVTVALDLDEEDACREGCVEDEISQDGDVPSDEENSQFEDSGVAPGDISANISSFSDMNLNITDEALSPLSEDCPELSEY